MRRRMFFLFSLLLAGWLSAGEEPSRVSTFMAVRADRPLALDGDLSDPVWAHAPAYPLYAFSSDAATNSTA